MTSLYQMLNGGAPLGQGVLPQPAQGTNMFQRMGEMMQAMRNPAAYVKQRFPDIPADMNDPMQILSYLQQTRGITDQQIQQLYNNYTGGNAG